MHCMHCNTCRVIGVLEAVNKRENGTFTVEDEGTFQAFALFCGLIIHSSRVHKEMNKAEQKIKVQNDMIYTYMW